MSKLTNHPNVEVVATDLRALLFWAGVGALAGSVVLAVLLLTGCAQYKTDYPSVCDIKKPDQTGTGYTKGEFPCKLSHHEGGMP